MKRYAFAFLFIILLILSLTGCNSKQTIEDCIEETFEVTQTDVELAEVSNTIKISNSLRQDVVYEVLEKNADTLYLRITTPNMYKILEGQLYGEAITDPVVALAEFENNIQAILDSGLYEYMTTEIEVPYIKTENGYEILETAEYSDAVNGGILSFANDYLLGAGQ